MFARRVLLALLLTELAVTSHCLAADQPTPPNIVLIFADDLGYSDVGCFGAKDTRTPNIDRLAAEGTRFTSFYVSQPVCTASRASLMTGCYANRVGLSGALNHTSKVGIHADEVLLPTIAKLIHAPLPKHRIDGLGDSLTDRRGSGVRAAGRVE